MEKYFYFSMSLLVAVTVVYGFSHTIDQNLIHPTPHRPWLLYLHGAVFSGWVVFFIFQSALVRTHNVRLHRRTGWFGVAMGALMPLVGISTAITMARFNILQFHSTFAAAFMIVPFFDIACFTIFFALAVYWRKKPELHRRLMLVATCVLTAAAFGRFPASIMPQNWFYSGGDLLILLAVMRDLIVTRRVHPVYVCALPALILGQVFAMHTFLTSAPYWMRFANAILS